MQPFQYLIERVVDFELYCSLTRTLGSWEALVSPSGYFKVLIFPKHRLYRRPQRTQRLQNSVWNLIETHISPRDSKFVYPRWNSTLSFNVFPLKQMHSKPNEIIYLHILYEHGCIHMCSGVYTCVGEHLCVCDCQKIALLSIP